MKKGLIGALVAFSFPLFAQNIELGVTVGATVYRGDIEVDGSNAFQQLRPAGGIFGRYHVNSNFAVRGQLLIGSLTADEKQFPNTANHQLRGFNFAASIVELSVLPEWRPFSVGNLEFYLFGGAAATYFNPTPNFNEPNPSDSYKAGIAADKSASFSHLTLAIPVGVGAQYFFTETFAVGGELGGRLTPTDYLDGISEAANPKSKDYYFYGGITVSKFFGSQSRQARGGSWGGGSKRGGVSCPTFR